MSAPGRSQALIPKPAGRRTGSIWPLPTARRWGALWLLAGTAAASHAASSGVNVAAYNGVASVEATPSVPLQSLAVQAALEARDLDGDASTAEAWYDTALDITWLADANFAMTRGDHFNGRMTWTQAQDWVHALTITHAGTGRVLGDWRLPVSRPLNGVEFNFEARPDGSSDRGFNIAKAGTPYAGSTAHELAHLHYVTLGNPGYFTVDGQRSGCAAEMASPERCLVHTGPFANIGPENGIYWTGTELGGPFGALAFNLATGGEFSNEFGGDYYVWAVHPGDVAAVPEPGAWILWASGLAALARLRRRVPTD